MRSFQAFWETNLRFTLCLVIHCFVIPHHQKKLLPSLKFIKNHSGQQNVLMNWPWAQNRQTCSHASPSVQCLLYLGSSYTDCFWPRNPGGGTCIWKGWGCSLKTLNKTPHGDQARCGPRVILTPKRDHVKSLTTIYFYISSHTTLNNTFTAKYNDFLPSRL